MRTLIGIGSIILILIFWYRISHDVPSILERHCEPQIHVHVPMTYKMIGRIHTDTLCVHPDTAMYANGNHRPVPEVLAGVARETLDREEIFILNHQ